MNSKRPWQIATITFAVLTLLWWSQPSVSITFKALQDKSPISEEDLSGALSEIQGKLAEKNATPSAIVAPVNVDVDPEVDAQRVDNKPAVNVFPVVEKIGKPSTNITAILETSAAQEMVTRLIPKEGTKSPYGLEYGLATFAEQKKWSKELAVDPAWKERYEVLATTIYHPCCGVTVSTNDCGHAVAATGLIKKMLIDGKSDNEIKSEWLAWQKYYFPRHYVIMALALDKMGQSLDRIDLSKEFSSIQSNRFATNYLVY